MLGTPSHENQRSLEELAYQAWLNRGCPVGSPEVDWDHACRTLSTQLTRVDTAFEQPQGSSEKTAADKSTTDAAFKELGSDEDTPSDPQSVSPFEAAAENTDATSAPEQRKPSKVSSISFNKGISKGKRGKAPQAT